MPITLTEVIEVSVGDADVGSISFDRLLDAGEVISSVTVAEVTSSDLTIGSVAANAAAMYVNNKLVGIGRGVQFTFSGQQASVDAGNGDAAGVYRLRITIVTDTPRTLVRDALMKVL